MSETRARDLANVGVDATQLATDADLASGLASKGDITTNGAWTAYTPTITGSSELGNGTIAAAYVQVGNIMFYRGYFTLGSTSVIDSNFGMTVPSAALVGSSDPAGTVRFLEQGVSTYLGGATWATTSVWRPTRQLSTTNGQDASLTANQPFTWGASDQIRFAFFYEVA